MLKALDDLEKAVNRLVKKTSGSTPEDPSSGSSGPPVKKGDPARTTGQSERINEEAVELIRRAIKRLRSL